MNKLRTLLLMMELMVIASLLIACDSSALTTVPTTVPTDVPEPPTAAPVPTEIPALANNNKVPRTTPEELKDRLDNGEDILIVDVRNRTAYDYSHIPGAVMAPENYDDFSHNQQIVLYCACPKESSSAGAALELYGKGFTNVSALLGGLNAWEEAEYPTEKTE